MKDVFRWYSPHVEQEIQLVRWGHMGTPVMLFPTAGGDAEEVERETGIGIKVFGFDIDDFYSVEFWM